MAYWLRRTGFPYQLDMGHIVSCAFASAVGLAVAWYLNGVMPQWWWRIVLASLAYVVVLGLVLRPRPEEVRIFSAVLRRRRGEPEPAAPAGGAPTA